MAFEWWWLLAIPLLFSLGWLAGHLDKRQTRREQDDLPRSYFRALNHLLNEQPDLAVDAFLEVVKLNPEMVELHLALGNLFRQRGEPDRAIRVHQNLLERTDLSTVQREHTLYELGQDFIKAGLLDRAESTLQQLASSSYEVQSKRALLNIYQSTRDWEKALEVGLSLPPENSQAWANRLSHMACELAEQVYERAQNDGGAAHPNYLSYVAQALKLEPHSVRARILQGRTLAAEGQWDNLIKIWDELAEQAPHALTLFPAEYARWSKVAHSTIDPSTDATLLQQLRAMFAPTIARWYAAHPSTELLDLQLQFSADAVSQQTLLQAALQKKPGAATVQRLLSAAQQTEQTVASSELGVFAEALRKEAQRQPKYICTHCGFKSARHYWQCPGCQQWDQLLPAQL